MPRFYTEVEAEFDVDTDEFLSSLDKDDIKELIELLKEQGYLVNNTIKLGDSIPEIEFNNTINKIQSNRLRLTNEEDEILRKIASRF